MKPKIENLKAWMSGKSTTGYQRALAMREFEQLLTYVAELEQLRQPAVMPSLPDGLEDNANTLLSAVREFEIWMEGYAATGERGTAQMIGKGFGSTFDEAVKDYMSKNQKHGIEENGRNRYMSEDAYNNRRSNWNIWACNLFDNEADARKSFG